jgi:hypothetical protein
MMKYLICENGSGLSLAYHDATTGGLESRPRILVIGRQPYAECLYRATSTAASTSTSHLEQTMNRGR